MTRLVCLLEGHLRAPDSAWFVVGHTRAGADSLNDPDIRYSMRQEMLRICGGFFLRLVCPMSEPDVQLWMAMEEQDDEEGDDLVEAAKAFCQARPCCVPQSSQDFYAWLRRADPSELSMAKLTWSPSILVTERDHAGNQRMTRAKQAKTRLLRRQCAAYICKLAAARWCRGRADRRRALQRRSVCSWREFRTRMSAANRRCACVLAGGGGGGETCCIGSGALRVSQGVHFVHLASRAMSRGVALGRTPCTSS